MAPWGWRLAHSSSDMDRRARINPTNSALVDPDHADDDQISQRARKWYVSNGGSSRISLFTRRGARKEINQDTMLAWERFGCEEGTIFCGVFDGHGKHGHRVSRTVRDKLPIILANRWMNMQPPANAMSFSTSRSSDTNIVGVASHRHMEDEPAHVIAWKESFLVAFKQMDGELLRGDFDSHSSGTTAVALVKRGNDLIVGNIGDSRAVLGTRVDDNSMIASQLTVDLIPNVPREAERIKRHKGRVFPLPNEPSVHRVWLPNKTTPGLAMARTFGDYCLKDYGVISEPEVTIRRLSKKDEFVVLATDGVWNVLTNQEVVDIVASTSDRSFVAEAVVDKAMGAWKAKSTTSKSDDCAVVCLFI